MKFGLLAVLMCITTVACTNKGTYNSLQHMKQSNCKNMPESQYEECIKQSSTSYEDYEKQRKKVLE